MKDFPEPVLLFQVGQERFPPLKTMSNTNLPRPMSSFVGRQRPEDRADHQPGDAFSPLSRVASALGVRECLPPSALRLFQRAEDAVRTADQVPGLGEAVVVVQLLGGLQRLLRVGEKCVRTAAQDPQGAQAEQSPRRSLARQREGVLEGASPLGDVASGRPEVPKMRGETEQ